MKEFSGGVYPTMITPYKNGEIDYDMVKRMVFTPILAAASAASHPACPAPMTATSAEST